MSSADGSGFQEAIAAFEELFSHLNARPLDAPWIERYRQRRTIQRPIVEAADVEWEAPQAPVVPNEVQQAALRAPEDTRAAGNQAGLVVLEDLPPGCEVTYELEAVEILKSLLRRTAGQADALDRYYADFTELHGVRPTAVEVYQDGYNPRAVRERAGSWARYVGTQGDLDESQRLARTLHV